MKAITSGIFLAVVLSGSSAFSQNSVEAPLSPNQGNVAIKGQLEDTNGNSGTFEITAVLKEGKFAGTARVSIGGDVLEGPLHTARSYLENKRCMFYLESGRSRAELYGPCNSRSYGGQGGGFDAWFPSSGSHVGKLSGMMITGSAVSSGAGTLPTGKLLCTYQERRPSFKAGEATQLGQVISMGALTVSPSGSYAAGPGGTAGRYTRKEDKLFFTSGPWAGAVGLLEVDRSGKPSISMDKEESASNGRIIPQTTRCSSRM